MNRFENVDVLAALDQLMRQNTAFYRNDFEIDKEIHRAGRCQRQGRGQDAFVDVPPVRDALFPGK